MTHRYITHYRKTLDEVLKASQVDHRDVRDAQREVGLPGSGRIWRGTTSESRPLTVTAHPDGTYSGKIIFYPTGPNNARWLS
jgi:hypothetical protein